MEHGTIKVCVLEQLLTALFGATREEGVFSTHLRNLQFNDSTIDHTVIGIPKIFVISSVKLTGVEITGLILTRPRLYFVLRKTSFIRVFE